MKFDDCGLAWLIMCCRFLGSGLWNCVCVGYLRVGLLLWLLLSCGVLLGFALDCGFDVFVSVYWYVAGMNLC